MAYPLSASISLRMQFLHWVYSSRHGSMHVPCCSVLGGLNTVMPALHHSAPVKNSTQWTHIIRGSSSIYYSLAFAYAAYAADTLPPGPEAAAAAAAVVGVSSLNSREALALYTALSRSRMKVALSSRYVPTVLAWDSRTGPMGAKGLLSALT